jgi:Rhs element Vgr protein
MSDRRVIPNEATFDFVTFDILSEGSAIDPAIQVLSISVSKEVNRIPTAVIAIRDGEASLEDFEISNKDEFIPGKKIEIKAGRDGTNTTIFKGVVVKQRIRVKEDGNSSLIVECKDECFKLTLGRKNKYYEDVKDSEVIEQLLGGLKGKVDTTKVKHKELVQHYCTDWDFILTRAEANGLLVIPSDGKLDVVAPDTSQQPPLTVTFGATMIDFDAEMDARTQWKTVVANAWDYKAQQLFETEVASVNFTENGNLSGKKLADVGNLSKYELRHSGHAVQEELKAWAEGCLLKSRLAKIRGTVKFLGFPELKPGKTLELRGVGNRFNGKVYLTAVRHELVSGIIYTTAQFGLSPEWFSQKTDVVAPTASGLLPGIEGLQIGKVVALEGDPDGEDRIQVKLPIIDNGAKGVWARLSTLDAGQNRGWVFRPEIDDEVIVGFVNSDPRDPIVLNHLHSSAKPAPIPPKDDNHIKGLQTRSEMKFQFDDEKKIITISTPAGNSIVISEEDKSIILTDQNSNTITMNQSGIELKSPKDIKLEATGKIILKATQDLTAEGLNVSMKANAQFKAEGQAGAALSTSAIAEVKGSLVKIN